MSTATLAAPRPAAAPLSPSLPLLQRSLPVYLILGSFFVLTLPFCALAWLVGMPTDRWYYWAYAGGLGFTHFWLTLTVYFQSSNLDHFGRNRLSRLTYFYLPGGLFAFFALLALVNALLPADYEPAAVVATAGLLLLMGVRMLDFQHFARQSFGVFQLFKGRSRVHFPAWMRRAENYFFYSVTGCLFVALLAGGWDFARPEMLALLALPVTLFAVVLGGFGVAWRRAADRSALRAPFGYFVLQAASAAVAMLSPPLYVFCLAMHYVEYHVLMVPRCFGTPLDDARPTDRYFGRLRQNKIGFYGVLLLLAAGLTYLGYLSMSTMGAVMGTAGGSKGGVRLEYLYLLNGLFVFHYVVESFIWRFSDPYYRRTLGPLYFGAKPRPAA